MFVAEFKIEQEKQHHDHVFLNNFFGQQQNILWAATVLLRQTLTTNLQPGRSDDLAYLFLRSS
jgi:hypothetical protein